MLAGAVVLLGLLMLPAVWGWVACCSAGFSCYLMRLPCGCWTEVMVCVVVDELVHDMHVYGFLALAMHNCF
jgi:hypothetical protein